MTTVLGVLEENNILIALVPANCTDKLQPLDVSVRNFYVGNFTNGMLARYHLTRVKPLTATWLIKLMDYLKMNPEIAINGFRRAGLVV